MICLFCEAEITSENKLYCCMNCKTYDSKNTFTKDKKGDQFSYRDGSDMEYVQRWYDDSGSYAEAVYDDYQRRFLIFNSCH